MDDKKIGTITALLAKANDPAATDAERDAFNAKATALMIKYGIEEANLAAHTERAESIVAHTYEFKGTYRPEYMRFTYRVAEALGLVTFVIASRASSNVIKLRVVGFESDVSYARLIIGSLTIQLNTAATREMRDYPVRAAATRYKYKRSFIVGFGARVAERIIDVRTRVVAESSPGTDLVLVDRRVKVERWVADAVGPLGKTRSARAYGVGGHAAGETAGSQADIGLTGVSHTGRREIGQ